MKAELQMYLTAIENYLDQHCFTDSSQPQQQLFESMRYSLLAGGKRLRPIFVLNFCHMCGGSWEKALPPVEISIVYSGADMNSSIHRPERCLPSQGHLNLRGSTSEITLADADC